MHNYQDHLTRDRNTQIAMSKLIAAI